MGGRTGRDQVRSVQREKLEAFQEETEDLKSTLRRLKKSYTSLAESPKIPGPVGPRGPVGPPGLTPFSPRLLFESRSTRALSHLHYIHRRTGVYRYCSSQHPQQTTCVYSRTICDAFGQMTAPHDAAPAPSHITRPLTHH